MINDKSRQLWTKQVIVVFKQARIFFCTFFSKFTS